MALFTQNICLLVDLHRLVVDVALVSCRISRSHSIPFLFSMDVFLRDSDVGGGFDFV